MSDALFNGCRWRVTTDAKTFVSRHRSLRTAKLAAARGSFGDTHAWLVEEYDGFDGVKHVWSQVATFRHGVEEVARGS